MLPDEPLTFDAVLADKLLGELFFDVEVERWDAQLLDLPSRSAVRDYLIGKGTRSRAGARRGRDRGRPALGYQARRPGVRTQTLTR